ncbi:hypothetical protein M9H77_23817 [Catharanthus roseus]|uniref:Uncharacterized protein n=1 Tax=Catharanthus roseus TaxID=4058 RepID=A0ACC0AUB9_CATRO|nr:hypothetical protein M9H77_23817 [Catharanthus roseus]
MSCAIPRVDYYNFIVDNCAACALGVEDKLGKKKERRVWRRRNTIENERGKADGGTYTTPRGGRIGGLGERGLNRPEEEVPRHEAWHEDNLFDDYGENPNIGQEDFGGYYGRQQGDRALDKIKWKVPSFKGESDPHVFLDCECQVENLFMVRNFSDNVKAKLVIAEFLGYALHWWERIVTQRV